MAAIIHNLTNILYMLNLRIHNNDSIIDGISGSLCQYLFEKEA